MISTSPVGVPRAVRAVRRTPSILPEAGRSALDAVRVEEPADDAVPPERVAEPPLLRVLLPPLVARPDEPLGVPRVLLPPPLVLRRCAISSVAEVSPSAETRTKEARTMRFISLCIAPTVPGCKALQIS